MKKFNMIDESFICEQCNKSVEPLGYTARNHCPYCLYSKHVDINPGDRAENCLGLLKPIGAEKAKKDTYKIIYQCTKCNKISKNKMASDDNYELLLDIIKNANY